MVREDIINIVLYKNRKFYCKQRSCYVTLRDIYDMYRAGIKLLIQEKDTNKDLTRDIILKSIYLCSLNFETKIKLLSKLGSTL
jgi:polyhydroxyalkanoate synthesis regulator protein